MSGVFHRSFLLAGHAGKLEALLWTSPRTDVPLAAVVCHPHPLYGGTLHNKVVFRAARTLHRLGVPVLRFNFRGVGLSEGTFDSGRGERDDVRTALDWLARQYPEKPLLVAGFSFGCWVGLRVGCEDERVTHLIGMGLPVNDSSLNYLARCAKPKLLVQGSQDQYGSVENVEKLFREAVEPKRLVVIEGADHFFTGRLSQVDAAIRAWMLETHPHLAMPSSGSGLRLLFREEP